MDKLQKRIRETEEEVAGEQLAEHLSRNQQIERDRALMIVGGFNAANKIQQAIGSELIRGLELFQSEQLYLSLGFEDFVTFLNSDASPLTKQQFYERKNLLKNEGDQLFDFYGSIGVSARKRKLFGKGNVELSGETLIVHDGDETTEISINDRSSVLDALTALADANAEKSIKIQRQAEQIGKHDDKTRELYEDIDRIRAAKIADFAADAHMTARVELGLAFNKFTDIVGKLSDVEKNQFRDAVLEDVAGWSAQLRSAYQTNENANGKTSVEIKGDSFEEALDEYLDKVDLDDVADNDGDLAAKL